MIDVDVLYEIYYLHSLRHKNNFSVGIRKYKLLD